MQSVTIRPITPIIKLVGFGLCLFLAATLCASPSSAQSQQANDLQMTLSPTSTRMELTPGQTADGSFTIFNSGSEPLQFKVYAAPYQITDVDYKKPSFTTDTSRTQIARWVQFAQTNYSVEPGKQVRVPYSVVVPTSIPDGGQYAALFAETESQGEGSITSIKRVGMLLYTHAAGTTIENGSAEAEPIPRWHMSSSLTATQTIKNSGNTDFDATAKLSVSDIFGRNVFTTDKTSAVLPETSRRIPLEWAAAPPLGIYTVTSSAVVLGKTTETSQLVIFTNPVALFAIVALLGLIIAGGTYGIIKRRAKPSLRRR